MKKLIDIAEIGKELDVPVVASYGPNREGPFYNQVWSKQYALRLMERVQPDAAGDAYVLTGHVDPWVSAAVIHRLHAPEVYFKVPAGETLLVPMARGACKYDGIITAECVGDDVFVTADFDKLEDIVGGPANVDLEQLAVPEIPAGKNVFFHGIGKFPFQMRTIVTIMDGCASLSCASGPAEAYSCAIPGGSMAEVGDTRART